MVATALRGQSNKRGKERVRERIYMERKRKRERGGGGELTQAV